MRPSRRLIVLAVLVMGVGLGLAPTAYSGPVFETPGDPYVQVRAFPGSGDQFVAAGQPFFLRHGYGNVESNKRPRDHTVHLFLDGVELRPDFVGCVDEPRDPGTRCRTYYWEFPDGLDEGSYQLDLMFLTPCRQMTPDGQFSGPIGAGTLEIQSCLRGREPIPHPDLIGQNMLYVGETPDVTLTEANWVIYLDEFGEGIHSIYTEVEARPMSEGAISDLYGYHEWTDEEVIVELCNVEVRDSDDDWVLVGDGYQTTEGCGENPDAMQQAFDSYGLPDQACIGVIAYGNDYVYCAPLEEQEPQPRSPWMEVIPFEGNLHGHEFPANASIEYLLPGGEWTDAGLTDDDGNIDLIGVFTPGEVIVDDDVAMRLAGDPSVQTAITVVDLDYDVLTIGSEAGGKAVDIPADQLQFCHQDECYDTTVDGERWSVDLAAEMIEIGTDWSFINYYDDEGDVQQVVDPRFFDQ